MLLDSGGRTGEHHHPTWKKINNRQEEVFMSFSPPCVMCLASGRFLKRCLKIRLSGSYGAYI